MSLIDNIYSRIAREPQNTESRRDKAKAKNITLHQLDRAKADIALWRQGIEDWEDIYYPDRTEMLRLYQEILNDDTVQSFIDSTINRIIAAPLDVVDAQGNIIEDKHLLFDDDWYEEIVRHFVTAELIGYRLLAVEPQKQGKIDIVNDIFIFPDHHLIPQWRKIMKVEGAHGDYIDYDPKPSELVELGDPHSFGLLNSIAPLYIYKKNALAYWSNFQSKFGIPPIIAKTELTNEQDVKELGEFLQTMASNSFAIVGHDDEIEGLKTNQSEGHQTYDKMIERIDSAIRRRLEGQTMTSEEGSSRAQAEVHQDTGDLWFYGRLRKFRRLINTQVMPILVNAGFDFSETDRVRFTESKNIDAIIDRTVKLYQAGMQVDADWLEEEIGMPLNQAFESGEIDEETMDKIMGKR